ncbi:MAG: hypothetical protein AAFR61_06620 [Bacteroidota bacterium]
MISLALMLVATTCQPEGPDCHYGIRISNDSTEAVWVGYPSKDSTGDCVLLLTLLRPDSSLVYDPSRRCIESAFSADHLFEFHILSEGIQAPTGSLPCDPVLNSAQWLKTFALTTEELAAISFEIQYP